jgi:hypothetical protein
MATEIGGHNPPSTITIDPRGDLLLIVGGIKQPVLVSARVLRMASEVFRAMLGPDFKEGKELAHHNRYDTIKAHSTNCIVTGCIFDYLRRIYSFSNGVESLEFLALFC